MARAAGAAAAGLGSPGLAGFAAGELKREADDVLGLSRERAKIQKPPMSTVATTRVAVVVLGAVQRSKSPMGAQNKSETATSTPLWYQRAFGSGGGP
jgi:hypothetical protein